MDEKSTCSLEVVRSEIEGISSGWFARQPVTFQEREPRRLRLDEIYVTIFENIESTLPSAEKLRLFEKKSVELHDALSMDQVHAVGRKHSGDWVDDFVQATDPLQPIPVTFWRTGGSISWETVDDTASARSRNVADDSHGKYYDVQFSETEIQRLWPVRNHVPRQIPKP
jgi:hypothetical protein